MSGMRAALNLISIIYPESRANQRSSLTSGTYGYVAVTKNEGDAADGHFSAVSLSLTCNGSFLYYFLKKDTSPSKNPTKLSLWSYKFRD